MQRAVQDSRYSISSKFAATSRLLRDVGFEHVIHSESISDRYFKVFFVRNNRNKARLGIVASKKLLPRAVDRNRAKRIIREAFRHNTINRCNLDMVVMVRRDSSPIDCARLDNLQKLFSQVKVRCAE